MFRHSLMVQLESVAMCKWFVCVGLWGAVGATAAVFCGCGYHLVSPNAPHHGSSIGYCVRSSDAPSVHPNAVAWLRAGALDGLSQWNLAGRCDGGPTIVLGPAQVSFDTAAVMDTAARADGVGLADGGGAPVARASRVTVRGEAHVLCCECDECGCCDKADCVKGANGSVGVGSRRTCEDGVSTLETCGRRFF